MSLRTYKKDPQIFQDQEIYLHPQTPASCTITVFGQLWLAEHNATQAGLNDRHLFNFV